MKQAKKQKESAAGRPVMVTTAHRAVFFGYASGSTSGPTIKLKRARMAVYWSADLRGVMGLATAGPGASCKIGPAADTELRDVTAVVEVSPEAAARWEAAPWK